MKKQLFQTASVRLASTYLLVLMLVSFVFSASLYRVLSNEFDRNYQRSINFVEGIGGFLPLPQQRSDFLLIRADDRDQGKAHILSRLVILNSIILLLGGILCFELAKRTLAPIEEAHTALERFTADASHELRTPLATMRTEIEVALLQSGLSVKEAQIILNSNLEEVIRLTTLSDRLLILARLDEHQLPAEPVDARDLMMRSVDAVQVRAGAKQVTIQKDVPKKMQVSVIGDTSSLCEVLVILLDNAIKYSPAKSVINLSATIRHKHLHIVIKDSGVGIASDDLPHIFERFFRADLSRTKNAAHGYGLGLALANKIIDVHGGRIDVSSKPGRGSTFTVVLPLS